MYYLIQNILYYIFSFYTERADGEVVKTIEKLQLDLTSPIPTYTRLADRASSPINLDRVQQALLIHHLSQSPSCYDMDMANNRKNNDGVMKWISTKNENDNFCRDKIQSSRMIRRNKLIDVVEMLEAKLHQLELEEDNLHNHLFQKESNIHGCQNCKNVSEKESRKEPEQHRTDALFPPPNRNPDKINPILSPGKVNSFIIYNESIQKRLCGCSIQSFERYVSNENILYKE